MAESDDATTHGLDRLDVDTLRRAVALYLEHAYPEGTLPEGVRARAAWDDSKSAAQLVAAPPFERVNRPADGEAPVFALRLGNHRYAHMKLQVQPWSNAHGVLFSVNTHDQALALPPEGAAADAFRALQSENQRIKEAIERSWDAAGLPTFLAFLRDYLAAAGPAGGEEA